MNSLKLLPDKVLIYATNKRGLLVFEEPDFPHIAPQVPGGTIDQGETPRAAAIREFTEETGLKAPRSPTFLYYDEHQFRNDGQNCQVNRYYFHAYLSDETPANWDNYENFAHNGADPILFRFFWESFSKAQRTLDLGTGVAIDALRKFLGRDP